MGNELGAGAGAGVGVGAGVGASSVNHEANIMPTTRWSRERQGAGASSLVALER